MFERKISQSVEQTYASLEKILVAHKCKINAREPPRYIQVTQGSLIGISPMTAKKVVSFSLSADGSQTKVESCSEIASDWKNLTLYGNVITALVIGVFQWITLDMNNYINSAKPGFWAWIAQIFETPSMEAAVLVSNLIQALALFLILVIIFEIIIVIYVYPRKNAFTQHVLEKISS